MFKFILLCFCINFAFSSPVIQFFIEDEIKLEQPQPIIIKDTSKNKNLPQILFKNTYDNNNNIENVGGSCYCTNYMGAIDQGITQMCCSSSGGKMSGNICISNWSSSGFGNCCKATGAYYGGCF